MNGPPTTWINMALNLLNADEAYDAFGRLRVSEPATLFSAQLQYDLEPYQFEAYATDAGVAATHSADTRMAEIKVAIGETGGTSGMQSYAYIPYQAGKSHAIFVTCVFGAPVEGAIKRIGYFDDANGLFFEQGDDGTYYTVLRSSTSGEVVERKIPKSEWNLIDDDTGRAGTTFNMERGQIFHFDLQFLGMGRVRYGLDIDGKMYYTTQYLNANNLSEPYMQTGTLPIRAEITAADALAADATMHLNCSEVRSEGGSLEDFAYTFSASGTATAGNNTAVHILSLRPETTFNTIENRIAFILDSLDITVTGGNTVLWQLCIGSTFTEAPTYADASAGLSGFEAGTGGTVDSVGTVTMQGFVAATASAKTSSSRQVSTRYPITLNRAGAARANGTLSLHVTGLGGTSATQAVINWKEIR